MHVLCIILNHTDLRLSYVFSLYPPFVLCIIVHLLYIKFSFTVKLVPSETVVNEEADKTSKLCTLSENIKIIFHKVVCGSLVKMF